MTNEIINKMVEEINAWIKLAHDDYKENGRSTWYHRTTDRINGMCRMLSIVTEKRVTWSETGVTIED